MRRRPSGRGRKTTIHPHGQTASIHAGIIGRRDRRGARGTRERCQPAGRGIDDHHKRAARTAVLEPGVPAAVALDPFTTARTPLAGAKHRRVTPLLRSREVERDRHLPHGLHRSRDLLPLRRLPGCQGRTKVRILLLRERPDPRTLRGRTLRQATLLRHVRPVPPRAPHQQIPRCHPAPPRASGREGHSHFGETRHFYLGSIWG